MRENHFVDNKNIGYALTYGLHRIRLGVHQEGLDSFHLRVLIVVIRAGHSGESVAGEICLAGEFQSLTLSPVAGDHCRKTYQQ